MKITVESKDGTYILEDTNSEETMDDFYRLAIRAALASGYAPLLVKEWFKDAEE